MGNKLGKRRHVIDEKYTRPQGLYHHKDVDHKKLKKLILESKLAPCYPGDEDCTCDLEECPICFLYYPSLNRSRCCVKGICTECFLQMKVPNSTRPTQCPFCKTSNYAVEYRGVKTKEEKGREQIEEQRVIEAKIRMRQQELLDDEERLQKRQELDSVSRNTESAEVEENNSETGDGDEIVSSQDLCSAQTSRPLPPLRAHREDEFDLDLEDIMVIEAIWLSIQESGRNKAPTFSEGVSPAQEYSNEERYVSPSSMAAPAAGPSSSSPSGGLACAIAALAERQQMSSSESPVNNHNMAPTASRFYNRVESPNYPLALTSADIASDCGVGLVAGEWNSLDHGSEVAEAGTSYASSVTEDSSGSGSAALLPMPDQIEGEFRSGPAPEGYKEQMMLAMALSLAEARAIVNGPEVSWQ